MVYDGIIYNYVVISMSLLVYDMRYSGWQVKNPFCQHPGSAYSSQVQDEAVSVVEAGPAEGNLRGPDHPPAFDVQQPLGRSVIGHDVVETGGHAPRLKNRGDSQ